MRITPTREQMEYLASIGVSKASTPRTIPKGKEPTKNIALRADKPNSPGANRWVILLLILLLLLFLARFARAEETMQPEKGPATAQVPSRLDLALVVERLDAIESEFSKLQDGFSRNERLEQNLKAIQETLISRPLEREIAALREDLANQGKDVQRGLVWFSVIAALGVGLLVISRVLIEKRIRKMEQTALFGLSETTVNPCTPTRVLAVSGNGAGVGRNRITEKAIKVNPTRPRTLPLLAPARQMQEIIESTYRLRDMRLKPEHPSGMWKIGLATTKGNVRSENQDYGLCFTIGGRDVMIMADGCGGLPYGQRAAHLAVLSAAASILHAYGMASLWHRPKVTDVSLRAIRDAAHRLAIEGDKLNITDIRGGLRTTLIVLVGNQHEVGYAYIGDGGGCVLTATGKINHFLDPQKASLSATNVLAASLGPMTEGEPVNGVLKRELGDLLIVGTDGVFDRVESTFPKDVLRGCIQYKGDLQKTAEHIVEELASFKDTAGYICDDNLTLGIMGDGNNPKLPPGFWSKPDQEKESQADPVSPAPSGSPKEEVS